MSILGCEREMPRIKAEPSPESSSLSLAAAMSMWTALLPLEAADGAAPPWWWWWCRRRGEPREALRRCCLEAPAAASLALLTLKEEKAKHANKENWNYGLWGKMRKGKIALLFFHSLCELVLQLPVHPPLPIVLHPGPVEEEKEQKMGN